MQQAFLGYDQSVAIAQKYPALASAVLGGKRNVGHDLFIGFDFEALTCVGATECAFIMGAADRYLQEDTVGFAGRPDNVTFVVHG